MRDPGPNAAEGALLVALAGRRLRARGGCRTARSMRRRRSFVAAGADYTRELERLAKLRDEGVITAEDFRRKKRLVLGI